MSDKKIKDSYLLKMKLKDNIEQFFQYEKLNYEEDAVGKLSRYALDFIIRILNDADELKIDDKIQKENVKLAAALETENRLAIYQPLPYRELIDISVVYNSKELPEVRSSYGLRIPLDNLTKINYKLKNKPKEVRKPTFNYNQLPNHLKFMNPFMSNIMHMPIPMCASPNPTPPFHSAPYATMYTSKQPPMPVSAMSPIQMAHQHLHHPYMQQASLPTSPLVSPQNFQSPRYQQPLVSYAQDMQMAPQRVVFRPRFNVVTGRDQFGSHNKRKNM